jgi:hypothetical protein
MQEVLLSRLMIRRFVFCFLMAEATMPTRLRKHGCRHIIRANHE